VTSPDDGRLGRRDDKTHVAIWAELLRQAPDAILAKAAEVARLEREGVDGQPLHPDLRNRLAAVRARLTKDHQMASTWHPHIRSTNAGDFAAVEQPADGSLTKEAKADVERNRDHL
jgi:hypothetical protein